MIDFAIILWFAGWLFTCGVFFRHWEETPKNQAPSLWGGYAVLLVLWPHYLGFCFAADDS